MKTKICDKQHCIGNWHSVWLSFGRSVDRSIVAIFHFEPAAFRPFVVFIKAFETFIYCHKLNYILTHNFWFFFLCLMHLLEKRQSADDKFKMNMEMHLKLLRKKKKKKKQTKIWEVELNGRSLYIEQIKKKKINTVHWPLESVWHLIRHMNLSYFVLNCRINSSYFVLQFVFSFMVSFLYLFSNFVWRLC